MAWKKILADGDPVTDLTGTAYRTLYVDSAGDVVELAHGTSGKFLKSQGASSDPIWDDPSVATLDTIGDVAAITEAQGQIIFRSATAWDALDAGTSGQFLKTQGASNDPIWANASVAAINDIDDVVITTPADNEVLAYDNGSGDWINQTPSEAGLKGASDAPTAHDLAGAEHNADTLADLNTKISDATLDDSSDTRTPSNNSVGNAQIDNSATDIAFAQIILTPATSGTGTTEGTLFYDSDDDHLYVYVA